MLGVIGGIALGTLFETRPYFFGRGNDDLGQLGILVIRLLKAVAVPLILFAILDAFARTRIAPKAFFRLVVICLVNVSVAMAIGLTLMNTLRPGDRWRGHLDQLAGKVAQAKTAANPAAGSAKVTLDPFRNVSGYVPETLTEPFATNNVIGVVLLAMLTGAALRRVKEKRLAEGEPGIEVVERFVAAAYEILLQMLEWVVRAVPFAVFAVVAQQVGKSGWQIFQALWLFLATTLLGLALHSLVYYPLVAWLVGRKSPREYLGGGADAILLGLSINSSLATVPVTLRCLTQKMGVSDHSARLAACVGTNLNNDGITLYEAMAALFLAQAIGMKLALGQQLVVVLASIMAGIGVAGVPEAGLVVLPLVLGAAGLPEGVVVAAIPLILPVDWIIARCRSGVNVMSDMLVAILLDATADRPTAEELAEQANPAGEFEVASVDATP